MRRFGLAAAICVFAVVAFWGCSSDNSDSGFSARAEAACDRFFTLAADAAQDSLTPDEIRAEVEAVFRDTEFADEQDIQDAGQAMSDALVEGSTAGFNEAVQQMADVCQPVQEANS